MKINQKLMKFSENLKAYASAADPYLLLREGGHMSSTLYFG